MKIAEREFNIYEGKRPRVLLLGNGLNRTYNGMSWDRLLDSIKDKASFPLEAKRYLMPMPLKAAMLTNNNLASAMRRIVKNIPSAEVAENSDKINWSCFTDTNPTMREQIRRIVSKFDYVLTTNYSYEIEMALLDSDSITPDKLSKHMNFHEVENAQTQFLINTFNLVGATPIWHIHGEARKPDSMIIGSAYYGKLLRRCVERIDGRIKNDSNEAGKNSRKQFGKEQEYKRNIKAQKPQKIGSWIDAFVLGDVYILGLGLDFSEAELWWLIDYKSNNRDICGQTFYFEPEKEHGNSCVADPLKTCDKSVEFVDDVQCRKLLLERTYLVKTEDLGVTIKTTDDYRTFYELAVNKIESSFPD